jgi:Alginate export
MKTIFFLFLVLGNIVFAQGRLDFKTLRYDEEYNAISLGSNATFFDKIKFLSIDKKSNSGISLGGELRLQYQYFQNENWGEVNNDNNGFILNRVLLHSDFKLNKQFRIFSQLQSSTAISRIDQNALENNPLDIHQLFFDILFNLSKNNILIRFGRQEMLFGSQRLVSVREGPNNRQSFDAVKVILKNNNFKSDVFYSQYVKNQSGYFDDRLNPNTKLYGLYNVVNKVPFIQNIDLYYFGLKRVDAKFDDVKGNEVRHSIGTRIWSKNINWNYDFETVYQFGSIENKTIEAWTVSLNTNYQFNNFRLKPKIGLKTEIISGDKTFDDDKLQTFNPLFPKGAYFGLAAIIGPSNLIDFHPSIELELHKDINLSLDYDLFWRFSTNDGIYQPNTMLIYSGRNTSKKYIGNQLGIALDYDIKKWFAFRIEGTWFKVQDYLKEVSPGKDILFAASTMYFRF